MFRRFWCRIKKALCTFFEFCKDPMPDALPTKDFDLVSDEDDD